MKKPAREPEAVSLDLELGSIEQMLLGAHSLVQIVEEHSPVDRTARTALSGARTTMAAVASRLKLLRAAIRNEIDPAMLLTVENTTPARVRPHEDPDVRLTRWKRTP